MSKIGFFGGTFDPIHNGHQQIANEILKIHNLDEIWFCPTNQNPHKLDKTSAPIEQRIKMIELAIAKNPRFKLLDIEASEIGPSYTVDTLEKLIRDEEKRGGQRQFHLIISDELVPDFFRWKDPKKIVQLVPLIVGSRLNEPRLPEDGEKEIIDAINRGFTKTVLLDISATDIRKRIRDGVSIEGLVPSAVLSYISEHRLYNNKFNAKNQRGKDFS